MKSIYLLPGQWVVAHEAAEITTILGSCVAVCLFDRVRRIGGMNHFLLATGGSLFEDRGRYGDTACDDLLQCFVASGSRLFDLEVWVLGGASVGGAGLSAPSGIPLGARNAAGALSALRRRGLGVDHEVTGGVSARRLKFQTESGRLELKTIDGLTPSATTLFAANPGGTPGGPAPRLER